MKVRMTGAQNRIDIENVTHGFFTRQGGVSEGIYESLNCGVGSEDDPEVVQENRGRVAEAIGAEPGNLMTLYQVHGKKCITVDKPWSLDDRPQADAFVTKVPGLALGILTADCVPVLLSGMSAEGPVIGAAHAGWKGAIGGVLASVVNAIKELGAEDIRAAIGPAIQKRSYEVSPEFYQAFIQSDENTERFFGGSHKSGHYIFDLPGYCALQLSLCGLGDVYISSDDTYTQEQDYFSYRRATHRKEEDYGRQLSVVMIQSPTGPSEDLDESG